MKKMRLALLGAATISMSIAAASCGGSGNEDEQNASVVNVEKGAASPMWTSDGEPMELPSEMPVPAVPADDSKEEAQVDSEEAAEPASQENSETKQKNEADSKAATSSGADAKSSEPSGDDN